MLQWSSQPNSMIAFRGDLLETPRRPENIEFLERVDRFLLAADPKRAGIGLWTGFADCMDRIILHEHLGGDFRFLAVSPGVEGLVQRRLTGCLSKTALAPWPLLDRASQACAARVADRSVAFGFQGQFCYARQLVYDFEIVTAPLMIRGDRKLALSRVSLAPA